MEDYHVDRPGVEARRRVKLTGTNNPIGLIVSQQNSFDDRSDQNDPDNVFSSSAVPLVDLVAMSEVPHPIPFRTRSLSPPEPMVLRLKARESRSPPGLPGGQKHCASPKGSSRTVLPHDPTVRRGMEQPGSSSGS